MIFLCQSEISFPDFAFLVSKEKKGDFSILQSINFKFYTIINNKSITIIKVTKIM